MPIEPVTYQPIGRIRTPFTSLDGMPIQAAVATDAEGTIELEPELVDGLLDLDPASATLASVDRGSPIPRH